MNNHALVACLLTASTFTANTKSAEKQSQTPARLQPATANISETIDGNRFLPLNPADRRFIPRFTKRPLREVLDQLACASRTNLSLDHEALSSVGVSLDEPTTFQINQPMRVSSILKAILGPHQLQGKFKGDTLRVTRSGGDAERRIKTRRNVPRTIPTGWEVREFHGRPYYIIPL